MKSKRGALVAPCLSCSNHERDGHPMSILVDVCADLLKKRTSRRSRSEGYPTSNGASLYLELLKRCLTNYVYNDDLDLMRGESSVDLATGRRVTVKPAPVTPEKKYYGGIWPSR